MQLTQVSAFDKNYWFRLRGDIRKKVRFGYHLEFSVIYKFKCYLMNMVQ